MASQPPQQPHRRPPPAQAAEELFQQPHRADSQAPSTTSIDSQTVFLNSSSSSPSYSAFREDPLTAEAAAVAQQTGDAASPPAQADSESRRCWICFSDDTEDTPQSSVWRTPCPCALTAHESCLLDWVADIESPDAPRTTAPPAEIRCPQCKSQIFLTRPRSNLLEVVGALEKYASKLLLPGVAAGTLYTFALTFSHHGAHTIRAIFNEQEAAAILATRTWAEMNWLEREALEKFPSVFKPFFRDWRGLRVELGLPLIPAAIVASRTTLADGVLPILPVVFFATHAPSSKTLTLDYWPPSAALAFVLLPYVRSMYGGLMERFWGEQERSWLKEIVPHRGEGDDALNADQDNGDNHNHDDDFEVDFEVELNLGGAIVEEEDEDDDDDAAPPNIPVGARHGWQDADGEGVPDDLAEAVEIAAAAQEREDAEAERRGNNGENRVDLISTAQSVADTLFGALLFPLISEGSGEVLKLLLPLSWTALPKKSRWASAVAPTGLLQTKWGRSLVGGCLFVVLKDAIRIYCRWRMAVSFRARRVRDYDKKLGKLI